MLEGTSHPPGYRLPHGGIRIPLPQNNRDRQRPVSATGLVWGYCRIQPPIGNLPPSKIRTCVRSTFFKIYKSR